ncbi:MAG: hypothetical protein Q4G33_06510 [bacterium]|nr:hypothetical protein [bacterium]
MDSKGYVVERCPFCENEIEIRWNVKTEGYKIFCPYCGKQLLLCDECLHAEDNTRHICTYNASVGVCMRCVLDK